MRLGSLGWGCSVIVVWALSIAIRPYLLGTIVGCWCHCRCRARARCCVVLILVLAWFIVVAHCTGCRYGCGVTHRHLLAPATLRAVACRTGSGCWAVCCGYGAGIIRLLPVLLSFTNPGSRQSSLSPIPVACHSPSPLSVPVSRCPAVHPASRGSQRWHGVGCGHHYKIFGT
jgi:hypothetical protein